MQPDQLVCRAARTRSGGKCQSPAAKGKRRCRMHGGTNPGAPKGNRNAWKHGGRSAETIAEAGLLRELAPLASQECELICASGAGAERCQLAGILLARCMDARPYTAIVRRPRQPCRLPLHRCCAGRPFGACEHPQFASE